MVKILVVDDSAFERKIIKKCLEEGGYKNVITASTGKEAVKKYKEEKPDLVLLDIVMEESKSGVHALREIKKDCPSAKVIMVTVVEQEKIKDETVNLCVDGYLTKPVGKDELLKVVRIALSNI